MRVIPLFACSVLLALGGCADGYFANPGKPVPNIDLADRLRIYNDPAVKINSGTEYKISRQLQPILIP